MGVCSLACAAYYYDTEQHSRLHSFIHMFHLYARVCCRLWLLLLLIDIHRAHMIRRTHSLTDSLVRSFVKELQEKDAKDQLRTALEDIKLKILQQESIVERLKRELAALHPESAEYAQAKVKYEESMMVMYALQINVMVFRKYVDEEEQPPDNQPAVDGAAANAGDVQHPSGSQQQQQQQQQQQHNAAGNSFTQGHAPSSPASGQGSPSSSSAVAAIAAARQGSSSRLTNLSAAGGGSQSNVFSGIQTAAPGGRRGTLLRLQRPATGVSLQRTIILEHVPELRGRAVYQSACDNLNAIMQDSTSLSLSCL